MTDCTTCHQAPSASRSKNASSTGSAALDDDRRGPASELQSSVAWSCRKGGIIVPAFTKLRAVTGMVKWQTMTSSLWRIAIEEFLESAEARPIRILSEYLEPLRRFKERAHSGHRRLLRFGARRTAGSVPSAR